MTADRTGRPWRGLALLVAGCFFMEIFDGTIVATAAPRMARSFGVQAVDLNATITVYLLTLGVFIPVSGWVADRFGARTVFGGAIAVFTLASGLCALSTSLGELNAVRVLQGAGGAMMVPVGRLVVLRAVDKKDMISAIAYLTWPALAAPLIAPALGGLIVTYASWRWIFVINIPLGLIAIVVTLRRVSNFRQERPAALDWWGFVLTGVSVGSIAYGLELVTGAHVAWPLVGLMTAAGIVLLAIAVFHLLRTAHPLLNLRVLRIRTFRLFNLGGSWYRLAIAAVPFLLPLMFQDAFGWSPVKAGVLVIAVFVGNIGIKPTTTPLMRRFGFRAILVCADLGSALTIFLCAFLTADTPLPLIAVLLTASGSFRSVGFTVYNTLAFADIPAAELSSANTLSAAVQQLTMGLGVAAGALALRVGTLISALLPPGTPNATRPFGIAFALISMLPLVALAESARLDRHAGSSIRSSRQPAMPKT